MNTCYIVLSESIQFAPLAGRILFKNLKYLSRNQSIIVLKGSVTWRYWLWSVREDRSNVKNDDGGDNGILTYYTLSLYIPMIFLTVPLPICFLRQRFTL